MLSAVIYFQMSSQSFDRSKVLKIRLKELSLKDVEVWIDGQRAILHVFEWKNTVATNLISLYDTENIVVNVLRCVLPLPLSAVLEELVESGRLKGTVVGGRQDKAVYIPDIYAKTQNTWVDSFLQQNGYLGMGFQFSLFSLSRFPFLTHFLI